MADITHRLEAIGKGLMIVTGDAGNKMTQDVNEAAALIWELRKALQEVDEGINHLPLYLMLEPSSTDGFNQLTPTESIAFQMFLKGLDDTDEIKCEYRNWRGETSARYIQPIRLWHGTTEWHKEPCLLLRGIDLEKDAERDFRVADFKAGTISKLTESDTI